MKLITAILKAHDSDKISQELTQAGYGVTCIASTSGFWKKGQSTLLIGVEDHRVDKALEIIRSTCSQPTESDPRKSIIFILNVKEQIRF